jgi:hypothetical protein
MQTSAWTVLLILNALWFGMGAFHFSLKPEASASSLVPRDQRASPLFRTLSDSIRFLGGLNFALMALCVMLLVFAGFFPEARQRMLFAAVVALAHASQFAVNVPMIGKWRRNEPGAWRVLQGAMLFIFAVDGTLMAANAVFGAWVFAGMPAGR